MWRRAFRSLHKTSVISFCKVLGMETCSCPRPVQTWSARVVVRNAQHGWRYLHHNGIRYRPRDPDLLIADSRRHQTLCYPHSTPPQTRTEPRSANDSVPATPANGTKRAAAPASAEKPGKRARNDEA